MLKGLEWLEREGIDTAFLIPHMPAPSADAIALATAHLTLARLALTHGDAADDDERRDRGIEAMRNIKLAVQSLGYLGT